MHLDSRHCARCGAKRCGWNTVLQLLCAQLNIWTARECSKWLAGYVPSAMRTHVKTPNCAWEEWASHRGRWYLRFAQGNNRNSKNIKADRRHMLWPSKSTYQSIHPTEKWSQVHQKTCAGMFMAVLFMPKPPKRPPTGEWRSLTMKWTSYNYTQCGWISHVIWARQMQKIVFYVILVIWSTKAGKTNLWCKESGQWSV